VRAYGGRHPERLSVVRARGGLAQVRRIARRSGRPARPAVRSAGGGGPATEDSGRCIHEQVSVAPGRGSPGGRDHSPATAPPAGQGARKMLYLLARVLPFLGYFFRVDDDSGRA
jgi:hypothetical protein